jgi:hypothetical protein
MIGSLPEGKEFLAFFGSGWGRAAVWFYFYAFLWLRAAMMRSLDRAAGRDFVRGQKPGFFEKPGFFWREL